MPLLLWWTVFFSLWYAGFNMWVSIIISFVVGWTFGRLLEYVGYRFINYNISFGLPVLDLPVKFSLPWYKRVLGTLLAQKRPKIKAEVHYRYGSMERWTFPVDGKWSDEEGIWVTVDQPMEKKLLIWERTPDGQHLQLDSEKTLLPDAFEVDIRFVTPSGEKVWGYDFQYTRTT
ncbi:MAG: hypothetical protein AB1894_29980 [Chloroflexota bacterium]